MAGGACGGTSMLVLRAAVKSAWQMHAGSGLPKNRAHVTLLVEDGWWRL